jgi:hypothetical protein
MVVLLARPQLQLDFHQDIIALVHITLAQQMYEKQYVMECSAVCKPVSAA